MGDDLDRLLDSDVWGRPAARGLALWLVALTAPSGVLARPTYALHIAFVALTGRKPRRGRQ